jgi:hypothetical protein
MKRNRLLVFSGILSLTLGVALVGVFGFKLYSYVYACEHETGAMPLGGCEAFLQLPVYLWSGFPVLFSGISLGVIGTALVLLGRFITRSETGGKITP